MWRCRFRDLANGILPQEAGEDSGSEDSLDEDDIEQAIQRLSKFETGLLDSVKDFRSQKRRKKLNYETRVEET